MEAPVAQLDDEWDNFSRFSPTSKEHSDTLSFDNIKLENTLNHDNVQYKSMEDLVHSFEETLASSFRVECKPSSVSNEIISSLEENVLFNNIIWKTITDNYGLVQPLDWHKSHIRKLHMSSLELDHLDDTAKSVASNNNSNKDIEDEELVEQMDLHKMVEYNAYSEQDNTMFFTQSLDTNETVMQTADEVIQELEQIMMKTEDDNEAVDLEIQEQTGIIISDSLYTDDHDLLDGNSVRASRRSIGSPSSQEESDRATELKYLSVTELSSICEQLESEVKELSAELLQQLNNRDELQFNNEVRNTLISSVLEVQYKQEQFRKSNPTSIISGKKFGRLKRSATTDSVTSRDGRYLTTVIPCNRDDLTLSNLQAMIRLLNAIKADSEEVPTLLTTYILTVLCPAPSGTHQNTLKL